MLVFIFVCQASFGLQFGFYLFLNSRQGNSTLDAILFSWLLVLSSRLLFHRDLKLLLSCGFKMDLAEMHDVDRCTPQIAGNHRRRIKSPFRLKIAVRMDDNWAEQEMRGCMNRELVAVCVRTAHGIQVLSVATETACYFVLKQGLLPPEVAHNLRTELLDIDRQSGTEKDTEELARSIPCSFHTLHAEC